MGKYTFALLVAKLLYNKKVFQNEYTKYQYGIAS